MRDPSFVCKLHHSSRQCRILNPLSEARDRTGNLMVPSRIHFLWATTGTPSSSMSCTSVSSTEACVDIPTGHTRLWILLLGNVLFIWRAEPHPRQDEQKWWFHVLPQSAVDRARWQVLGSKEKTSCSKILRVPSGILPSELHSLGSEFYQFPIKMQMPLVKPLLANTMLLNLYLSL